MGINAQAGVTGHAGDSTAPCRNQCPRSVARTLACNAVYWAGRDMAWGKPCSLQPPFKTPLLPPSQTHSCGERNGCAHVRPRRSPGSWPVCGTLWACLGRRPRQPAGSRSLPTPKTQAVLTAQAGEHLSGSRGSPGVQHMLINCAPSWLCFAVRRCRPGLHPPGTSGSKVPQTPWGWDTVSTSQPADGARPGRLSSQ